MTTTLEVMKVQGGDASSWKLGLEFQRVAVVLSNSKFFSKIPSHKVISSALFKRFIRRREKEREFLRVLFFPLQRFVNNCCF